MNLAFLQRIQRTTDHGIHTSPKSMPEGVVPLAYDTNSDHDEAICRLIENLGSINTVAKRLEIPERFIRYRVSSGYIYIDDAIISANETEIVRLYGLGMSVDAISKERAVSRHKVTKVLKSRGVFKQKSLF